MKMADFKYMYTGNFVEINGKKIYQIVADKDFMALYGPVKKGELGGFVASMALSQEGNCWVDKCSIVEKGCYINGDAVIAGKSHLSGNVTVRNKAFVFNSTLKSTDKNDISIYGDARVMQSTIEGGANLSACARIELSKINGFIEMTDNAEIFSSDFDIPKGKISMVNEQRCALKKVEGFGPWGMTDNIKVKGLIEYKRDNLLER